MAIRMHGPEVTAEAEEAPSEAAGRGRGLGFRVHKFMLTYYPGPPSTLASC